MELPYDILGYLSYFVKPKKYTLIDKFCRDHYFRKNGVYLPLMKHYKKSDILHRYHIRLIDYNLVHDSEIKDCITDENILSNILHIKCAREINHVRYNILRETFTNLKTFVCKISASDFETGYPPLEGTVINICYMSYVVNLGTEFGYKIQCNIFSRDDEYISKINSLSDNIVKYAGSLEYIDIDKFPNLRKINTFTDITVYRDKITKHPNLNSISYNTETMVGDLVKTDGSIIKCKRSYWNIDRQNIPSPEMYEEVRNAIKIMYVTDHRKIIEYEKKILNKKKIKVFYLNDDKDVGIVQELLEFFDVRVCSSYYYLRNFTILLGEPKIKFDKNERTVYIFKSGNNRLELLDDYVFN